VPVVLAPMPPRRFWLVSLLGLPAVNLVVIAGMLAMTRGDRGVFAFAVLVLVEVAFLAAYLRRRGLRGHPLAVWLVAGAGSMATVTFVVGVAGIIVAYHIAVAQCADYDCAP
jgi:hypothetical protein